MLVPMRAILETADQFNYAQGSFNVNAVAQAKAAIAVHEQFRSPAILQGADLANAFMGGRTDFLNGTVEDKIKGAANIGAAVKKYGEGGKVAIRNIRRDAMEKFKAMKKKSEITEDDLKECEETMQKMTDKRCKEIDELTAKKEAELMAV